MKFLRATFLPGAVALGVALSFSSLAAQGTGTVTGQVLNADTGQPLGEAQMVVVGTNIGVLTNGAGRYLINRVPLGTQEIRAVLLGFAQQVQTVTVTAGESSVLDFSLNPTAIALEALVVSSPTGRQQRARELGSKVGQVDVTKLNPAPITDVAAILSGRTEGVIVGEMSGTTGTSDRIRIRGANSLSLDNSPLIYLDGVQINSEIGGNINTGGSNVSRLNDINPNDIESVEIVKGPAASALYGTAAANGVILITTKRGRPGVTDWTFFAETGNIDDNSPYRENFLTYQTDDSSQPLFDSNGVFNTAGYSYCPNRDAAGGSCVQDGTLRFNTADDPRTTMYQSGFRNRYGASVRGGTEQVRYFVSGQLEEEEGVISTNRLKKMNLRANLDAALSETVDLSVSFGYTDSDVTLNPNDNNIFSPVLNMVLGEGYYVPPTSGEFPEGVANDNNYGFGFNLYEIEKNVVNDEVNRLNVSSNITWRPFNWLNVTANGGIDLTDRFAHTTVQPGDLPISESWANGFRRSNRQNSFLYSAVLSGIANFELTPDLYSTTTLGTQYTKNLSEGTDCYGSSLVLGTASCSTTSALFNIDENYFEIITVGWYVQEELAWRDKVFLAGGLRGDDNSAFGNDFGFVYYPSVSLSWVAGEEDWFPEWDFMSGLRVRGAYGTSGLRPGMRDAVTLYAPTTVATADGDVSGVALNSLGNTQLKPEKSTEYEFGADLGLFQDKLGIDFTYFNKKSKDALIDRRLPGSLGLTTTVFANLGEIQNTGTELSINWSVVQNENIGLNLGFTNTTLHNEILELGEGVDDITLNRGQQRHREGESAGSFFQRPISWNDADGNGILTNAEVTVGDDLEFMGVALPEWNRTFFADIRLLDWITLSTLIEGRGGHQQIDFTENFRCGFRSTRGCDAVGDPDAPLEKQAAHIADRYLGSGAGFIYSADFYKWRELSLTFDMPSFVTDYVQQMDGLRVTAAGRNLAVWTDYPGLDPEANEGGGDDNFGQSEFNTQPPVRYFMLRFDYSF